MATASEEFLVRFRNWLVSGGVITRIACGMTTRLSVGLLRSPKALAASTWPRDTALMPARTISAMKAAV